MKVVFEALEVAALSVALTEPFVIASGRVDATRAALVQVVARGDGLEARGLGEAAALPPVTREDQPEVLDALERARAAFVGAAIDLDLDGDFCVVSELCARAADGSTVARAGLETAALDAISRLFDRPLRALLGGDVGRATRVLETDITLPIQPAAAMAAQALRWRALGFSCFKVKVGVDADADVAAIAAVHAAVPDATFRVDANAGFSARVAIAFARALERRGVAMQCFEQPCAADDLDGMAEVARAISAPVVADESVKSLADLDRVAAARACGAVNLKLAKSGGPLGALAIGRRARALGLGVMCGGMVETRLGMTAAAHVAAALGGVEFVDLDTAWLLADDPFTGGYTARGPRLTLVDAPGLGVDLATS
ncbi:MAG TPA: enolase C-terminal domain-like protein [Byssovorax sp.]